MFLFTLFFFLEVLEAKRTKTKKNVKRVKSETVSLICKDRVIKTTIYNINGIKYISLREVAEMANGTVYWTAITGRAVLRVNYNTIAFVPGTKKYFISGKVGNLKSPTRFLDGEFLIPLSFISSSRFEKITGAKFELPKTGKYIVMSKSINLYTPRCYVDKDRCRILFNMTEPLKYEITSTTGYLTIVFYNAQTDEKVINPGGPIGYIDVRQHNKDVKCEIAYDEIYTFQEKYEPSKLQLSLLFTHPNLSIERKKRVIVIDPGHGGIDPGAEGPEGSLEKDINLEIAKHLAELFKEDGFEVYLTREEDVFVPLVERTRFANEKKADVFISVHCNALRVGYGEGFEIYFLSETATDADAAAVAMRENEALEYETYDPQRSRLQEILWSMKKNIFMNESSEICGYISNFVTKNVNIKNNGIKQANFFVLRGADMPAILLECAYIDNPVEERLLNSKIFQYQIADAVFLGVKEYFKNR